MATDLRGPARPCALADVGWITGKQWLFPLFGKDFYGKDRWFLIPHVTAYHTNWEARGYFEGARPSRSLAAESFMALQWQSLRETIAASINHPSVILWGFLNEGEPLECMKTAGISPKMASSTSISKGNGLISQPEHVFRGGV